MIDSIYQFQKKKIIYEYNHIGSRCKAFFEWSCNLLLSYKYEFCTTLQIEPSYLLVLNHNLEKYRIDVMHSDSFRYA
jgi:hypothetical protein